MTLGENATGWRSSISWTALALGIFLIAATFFLISPQPGQTFPGAREWSEHSLLKPLIDLMALGGLVSTERGVEIKALAFHVAAIAGLVLFAMAAARANKGAFVRSDVSQLWFGAQVLFIGWVLLSLASVLWSGDADIAYGQAALYLLAICWTISVAWTLDIRHVRHFLNGLVAISAAAAGLCVWYFIERNPEHRPGFPIGNPSTVAASVLPGFIIALFGAIEGMRARLRGGVSDSRHSLSIRDLVLYAVALIPLGACLYVTSSRGALAGLALALSVGGILIVGRRVRRWLLPVVLIVLAVGAYLIYRWSLEAGMGRGGSMRFRFYAWEYAARMWWTRPFTGHGAGAFTRFAGDLSQRDRVIDRDAFAGDWLDHAHNELFEILAEIGLVGGVTYVAALIATVFAGIYLCRARTSALPGWMRLALLGSVVALIGDSMVGVGMRLEGVQAVYYTLLGVLFAAARGAARDTSTPETADLLAVLGRSAGAAPAPPEPGPFWLRAGVAAGAIALSVGCATLAMQNWFGVLAEAAAGRALAEGRPDDARQAAYFAEYALLTPFRKLVAGERVLQARFVLAEEFARQALAQAPAPGSPATQSAPTSRPLYETATELARRAYDEAIALDQRAPGFGRALAVQARSAEILAILNQDSNAALAAEWASRAQNAWILERRRDETDAEALLALMRYPATLPDYAHNLQRALRSGFPSDEWRRWFARFVQVEGFDQAVALIAASAESFDPRTNLDSIVLAAAPEAFRLSAYWHGAAGAFSAAAADANRAAELYEPMRSRFPELYSVARAEQADFVLRADPANAPEAIRLLEHALQKLPAVSQNKAAEMRQPYLLLLLTATLAADGDPYPVLARWPNHPDAAHLFAEIYTDLAVRYVRRTDAAAYKARGWLTRVLELRPNHLVAWSWVIWFAARDGQPATARVLLKDAAAAGVSERDIERIKASLCKEFPALCEAIRQ